MRGWLRSVRFLLCAVALGGALLLTGPAYSDVDCYEAAGCTTCIFTAADGKPAGYAHWCPKEK